VVKEGAPDAELSGELGAMKAEGLYRFLRSFEGPPGPRLRLDGRSYLCFCSNNYLGLAAHPVVMQAARDAIERYGWGSGASRLISGTMRLHGELEERLAEFKRAEAAIVFPTGYMTNLGVISSLTKQGDLVVVDKLDHASIIDGCRLSGAKIRVYPHRDVGRLEKIMAGAGRYRRRLVVTDSVFSMDGDLAPLREIIEVARRFDSWVMVDEAHATGVLGENGRGGAELLGVEDGVDISMGTLSKALGGAGGFVAGSAELIDYLRNRARSFIYTTALPIAACAAAVAAVGMVEKTPRLREELLRRAETLRTGLRALGFDTMGSGFHIVPVLAGDSGAALELSERLFDRGVIAPAIRPPTVPRGKSRLRLSVMATHSDEDIEYVLDIFRDVAKVV
jgi:8-amino-7-oxononanoate synthase